jgi:hypothetical protein
MRGHDRDVTANTKMLLLLGPVVGACVLQGCSARPNPGSLPAETQSAPSQPQYARQNPWDPWAAPQAQAPMPAHRGRPQGAGGSWSLVFSDPMVNDHGNLDSRDSAEYGRNDYAMAARQDGPLLATAEWPERERASLAYPRRVFLNNQPDQLLFFENESLYRSGVYGRYRTTPSAPGDGVWGFWR